MHRKDSYLARITTSIGYAALFLSCHAERSEASRVPDDSRVEAGDASLRSA